jgi:dihydroneopterin aldolase
MADEIVIRGLEVLAHIGAAEEERAQTQRLTISLRIVPVRGFAGVRDELAETVDYAAVFEAVKEEVRRTHRRLIETLAEELAAVVLRGFAVRAVEVEIRKYIFPETEYVAVSLRREQGSVGAASSRPPENLTEALGDSVGSIDSKTGDLARDERHLQDYGR